MAERGNKSGWKPHSTGVVEALIAATLGFSLVPLVTAFWQRVFHSQPPEWAKGAVPNLAAALVLSLVFWLFAQSAGRWRQRYRHATARAKGDRISIYVAHFGDDEISQTARDSVIASIRNELGKDRAEVVPAGIQLRPSEGTSTEDAAREATGSARALLKKKGGDLLIWGLVHTIGQTSVIELRFVTVARDGSEGLRFGFTEKLILEAGFGKEMGAALAAMAVSFAAPVTGDKGKYIAGTLTPIASRLARLVQGVPASLGAQDRASLFRSYGLIQETIGDQAGDSERLKQAVSAYRTALEECTREQFPLDWAATQNNLGNALATLGERESGTARLEEALGAHREALTVRTRDRAPLDWAASQNSLGRVLSTLGERESGTARLEEAVAAYREALKEFTRDQVPLFWSVTQNNLGNALQTLGARESETARLEEAIVAYREALKEFTRKRVPLRWAMTQNNMGNVQAVLGERKSRTALLEQAVATYREVLKEWARDRVPLDWAATQNCLGSALQALGERESGTARLEEAVAAYREALKEFTREMVPLRWAATQAPANRASRR